MNDLVRSIDTTTPGRPVVVVEGELDMRTAPSLRETLLDLVGEGTTLVVDLSGLDFLDSSGLSTFIAVHKRATAQGGRVVLDRVPDFVDRVLAITGLREVFLTDTAP